MQDAPPVSSDSVFAHIPPGAEGHFLLHFYAVIARLLAHLHIVGDSGKDGSGREGVERRPAQGPYVEQFPFLAGYQAALNAYLPGGAEPGGAINLAPTEAWWDE